MSLILARLISEQNVNFLLDPILVVGQVSLRILLIDQARQIGQLIDEIKELESFEVIFYSKLIQKKKSYLRNVIGDLG